MKDHIMSLKEYRNARYSEFYILISCGCDLGFVTKLGQEVEV